MEWVFIGFQIGIGIVAALTIIAFVFYVLISIPSAMREFWEYMGPIPAVISYIFLLAAIFGFFVEISQP
jgi:hypothetical protein